MNVEITTYTLQDKEPSLEHLAEVLDKDYEEISEILGVEPMYDESTDYEDYLWYLEEGSREYGVEVPRKIPPEILDRVNLFLDIPSSDSSFTLNEEALSKIFQARVILGEQLEYLFSEQMLKECRVWFVIARVNGLPYGGTLLFYNPSRSSDILTQGISRFFIPSLCEIVYPGLLNSYPKLNSLLIPVVESVGKSVGAERIVAAPVGNQGSILQKHYGFKRSRITKYPCPGIRGEIYVLGAYDYPVYSKDLTGELEEL